MFSHSQTSRSKPNDSVTIQMDMIMALLREPAAITIQKNIRGFFARKAYAIRHLTNTEAKNSKVYTYGNDPVIKGLAPYKSSNEKIAVIGTSGLRVLAIACRLGSKQQKPKIIIIDNSLQVYAFWRAIRDFAQNDNLTGSHDAFFNNLDSFLEKDIYPLCKSKQDIPGLFKELFQTYGYHYVRDCIRHISLIKQSWGDADTFVKVKNILNYNGIDRVCMYPSNIAAYDYKIINRVLSNIANTKPFLSIHTDLCYRHGEPENVYLVENQDPSQVKKMLFSKTHKTYMNEIVLLSTILMLIGIYCIRTMRSHLEYADPNSPAPKI